MDIGIHTSFKILAYEETKEMTGALGDAGSKDLKGSLTR